MMKEDSLKVTGLQAKLRCGDLRYDLDTLADGVRRGEFPAAFAEKVLAEARQILKTAAKAVKDEGITYRRRAERATGEAASDRRRQCREGHPDRHSAW
jgi:hypothetical protein